MTRPVVVELRADGKGVISTFRTTEREAAKLQRRFDGTGKAAASATERFRAMRRSADQFGQSATRMGRTLSLSVTAPLVAAAAAAAKLAIDAEETANKFNVVFGPAAEKSRQQLQALTDTIPLTVVQMQGLAAGIQDMLVPMGVAREDAAGMSVDMVQLAGDLASFNNVGTDRVLEAMQSALAGSSEPMRRFGVDTRVTRLEQIALEEGLIGVGEELDNTARAQATLIAVTRDSTDAIGDAERTVDSAANQLRFLQRDVRQLGEDLGESLIPAVRELVPELRDAVNWFGELDPAAQRNALRIGALAAAAGPAALALGGLLRAVQVLASPVGMGALALSVGAVIGYKLQDTFREWASGADTIENKLRSLTPRMDQFTGSVARMREEFLRSQLDEARTDLEALERVMGDVGARSRLGVTNGQLEAARDRVAELSRQLEINEKRWAAHNRRVIEADNGIGGWGSSMVAAIEMATNMAGSVGELSARLEGNGDVTDELTSSVEGFIEATRSQIESLREERMALRGGTQAVLEYRREKLAAQGASEEVLSTIDELIESYVDEEEALAAVREEMEANEQAARRMADWMAEIGQKAMAAAFGMESFGEASARANERSGGGDGGGQLSDGLARAMSSALSARDGQSMGESIGNALRAHGTDAISKALQDTMTEGLEAANENISAGEGGLAVATMAVGNAMGEQMGAAVGNVIGGAIGSIWGPAGAMVGAAIGGAIGGLFDEQKKRPRFNFGGASGALIERKSSITPNFFSTALEDRTAFGSTGLDDQSIQELVRGIQDFDRALASAIEGSGAGEEVREALEQFTFLSDEQGLSLDQMMQARFDAAIKVFDGFIQVLVKRGDTLEDQMQRLQSVFAIEREMMLGNSLGLQASTRTVPVFNDDNMPSETREEMLAQGIGFNRVQTGTREVDVSAMENTLLLVEELSRSSETLADTFNRLHQVTELLDTGLALTGQQFEGSREDLIRFGDELTKVFGDDLDRLSEGLNRIYGTFFSDEERLGLQADQATARATSLLSQAGVDVSEDMLTLEGFRELWDELFMTLGPEGQAVLIEAGVAVADLIDAEERLASTREEVNREYQRQMDQVVQDLRGIEWSPLRQEFFNIRQSAVDATAALRERGGSEQDYALVLRRYTLQTQALAGTLRASLMDLRDQFMGGGNDIGASMSATAGQIGSTMGQIQTSMIDAIQGVRDWLDSSLLGNNSPLLPQEQLNAAGSQFWDAIDAARGGDADAASELPQLADQFLGNASSFWGTSTAEYRDIFDMVREAMQGVADMDVAEENGPPTYGQQSAIVSATQSTQNSALEQARLAGRMIDEIGVLARISQDSTAAEIAEELDLPIGRLIEAVTGELPNLTGDALGEYFNELVAETDAQLSTLGRIEGVLEQIRDALGSVVTEGSLVETDGQGRGMPSDDPPPGMATGGWSTGIVNTGERGPELILDNHVSEFFRRNGVPVNNGGSDPQARALLARIEQRLARMEEQERTLTAEQIRAIREGNSEMGLQLNELVQIEDRKARQPNPAPRIRP